MIVFIKQWRRVEKYIFDIAHKVQFVIKRAKHKIVRLRKRLTKTKRKRDDVLMKRNEVLIDRDNVNAKREKIIDLFNKTMTGGVNAKKNDNVEFKSKKKMISFKIVTTANEKDVMMKEKISIENNDSYMFEILDMKDSTERILIKHYINDTTSISDLFETSTFDVEIFLK